MTGKKIAISKLVIVEGKYDKIKLENILDADIVAVDGFGACRKTDKMRLIKELAEKKGVLIATDSDYAGYKIRVRLQSILKNAEISHVFIPNIKGKEKRKQSPSKEGFLGLEGIEDSKLYELFVPYASSIIRKDDIKTIHLYELGLIGKENSNQKRSEFLDSLGIAHRISNTMLLRLLNERFTLDKFIDLYYK